MNQLTTNELTVLLETVEGREASGHYTFGEDYIGPRVVLNPDERDSLCAAVRQLGADIEKANDKHFEESLKSIEQHRQIHELTSECAALREQLASTKDDNDRLIEQDFSRGNELLEAWDKVTSLTTELEAAREEVNQRDVNRVAANLDGDDFETFTALVLKSRRAERGPSIPYSCEHKVEYCGNLMCVKCSAIAVTSAETEAVANFRARTCELLNARADECALNSVGNLAHEIWMERAEVLREAATAIAALEMDAETGETRAPKA